jgi:hypothetical protein
MSSVLFVLLGWVWVVAALQGDSDQDGLSDDTEARLVERFMPRFHFHHDELFFPTSVDEYLVHTQLYYQQHAYAPHCEFTLHRDYASFGLPVLTVSSEQYEVCADLTQPSRLRGGGGGVPGCGYNTLECDLLNRTRFNIIECSSLSTRVDQTFHLHVGRALRPRFNASVPVYAHVSGVTDTARFPADHFVVQYWLFYAFNGALDDMLQAGAHEGDWEHVSVVVDPSMTYVAGVYMAAHSHEASWLQPGQFTLADERHVQVYVALHSHAAYQTPGVKKRIDSNIMYSFLHDHCSDKGYTWAPTEVIHLGEKAAPLVSWGFYNGFWGSLMSVYSFIPLALDTASPPKGPMHQIDYWFYN